MCVLQFFILFPISKSKDLADNLELVCIDNRSKNDRAELSKNIQLSIIRRYRKRNQRGLAFRVG